MVILFVGLRDQTFQNPNGFDVYSSLKTLGKGGGSRQKHQTCKRLCLCPCAPHLYIQPHQLFNPYDSSTLTDAPPGWGERNILESQTRDKNSKRIRESSFFNTLPNTVINSHEHNLWHYVKDFFFFFSSILLFKSRRKRRRTTPSSLMLG